MVLNAVKTKYLEIKHFVDDTIEEECQKEKISAREAIFYKSKSEKLAQEKHFLFYSKYVKSCSEILLAIIFTCVLFKFSLPKAFVTFHW